MELTTLKNVNKAFKETRILAVLFAVILLFGFCFAFILLSYKIDDAYRKSFIFDNKGNIYMTSEVQTSDMRAYEYENHVKMFFNNWYSFDEYNYEEHIKQGLELIGEKGKELMNEYNDISMLNTLVQKNIRYSIKILDIKINMNTIPISGYIEGIQTGYRAKGSISRKIRSEFTLYDVTRSKRNVHGCKIRDWNVKYYNIENENE